jgi:hypothetical protein
MGRSCPDDLRGGAERAGFDALLLQPITATTLAQVGSLLIQRAALVRQRAAKRRTTARAGETVEGVSLGRVSRSRLLDCDRHPTVSI